MQMGTERNNGKLTILTPAESSSEISVWLVEQLIILAEAMGEALTPERMKIYVAELADIDQLRLAEAFQRARRECRFFPKIADLREFAGAKQDQRDKVEAQAAFGLVIRHLEDDGVEAGLKALPARVQYAVRQCGGLFLFNRRLQVRYGDDENPSEINDSGYVFLQRDFLAAYKAYDVHQGMTEELIDKGLLPESVKAFLRTGQFNGQKRLSEPAPAIAKRDKPEVLKVMPKIRESLTPVQIRNRREMLAQQAATLLRTRGIVSQGQQEAQTAA